MMKRFIVLMTAWSLFAVCHAHGAHQVTCTRDMMPAYQTLIQLPEAKAVVDKALENGPIRIESSGRRSGGFEGMWDSGRRAIVVSPTANRTVGQRVNTLMMEFHNAKSDREFDRLFAMARSNRLSKDKYVEEVERVEHINAVNSSKLLAAGIKRGVYPADAAWNVFADFDSHYQMQQICDHSLWIAREYDRINPRGRNQPYRGTIPDLHRLSGREKSTLCHYLYIKNDLKTGSPAVKERAQQRFARELSRQRMGGQRSYANQGGAPSRVFQAVFGNSVN